MSVLSGMASYQRATHIACYYPVKGELNTLPIIEKIWQDGKKCYLPVLAPNNRLTFHLYDSNTSLKPNCFGILEPEVTSPSIELNVLELILMPLVAFDKMGNRLGTGGGYYDRTLAGMAHGEAQRARFVGLAFSVQEANSLPAEAWDIHLDGIVTEKKFLKPVR